MSVSYSILFLVILNLFFTLYVEEWWLFEKQHYLLDDLIVIEINWLVYSFFSSLQLKSSQSNTNQWNQMLNKFTGVCESSSVSTSKKKPLSIELLLQFTAVEIHSSPIGSNCWSHLFRHFLLFWRQLCSTDVGCIQFLFENYTHTIYVTHRT